MGDEIVLPKYLEATLIKLNLNSVKQETFEENPEILAKSRYMYWASYIGNVLVARKFIEEELISPFYRCINGQSPIMISVIERQLTVLRMICSFDYRHT